MQATDTLRDNAAGSSRGLPLLLLFSAVFLLSAFDVYFPILGIPVVSVAGTVALLASMPFLPRAVFGDLRKHLNTIVCSVYMVLVFLLCTVWGAYYSQSVYLKAFIGMTMGLLIFNVVALREDSKPFKENLFRCLSLVLAVHVGCMIIQFVYFLWNPGTYLDFIEPITGVPTRHLHGLIGVTGPVTRFTGLFAEPAIYSAFIYMCVSARMLRNNCRFTRFDWLASITMLFSLSIYGYFLFSILIGTMLVKTGHAMRALAVAVMVLAPAIGFLALSDNPVAQMIQVRVEAPLSDPSGNVRLNKPFEYYDHLPDQAQAFGIGLGNYDEEFGEGNGIASLLVFLGAFGTAGFAITLGAILVNREFPLAGWVFLGATMLGAPLFTNQYWWLWIGMMLIFGHKPRELASRPEPAVPA